MNLHLMRGRTLGTPQNILLTRLSAIGDCILTLPLAADVKRLWPNAKLTWIVDCAAEQLLRDHSCIDELIRIERHWLKKPSNWGVLRNELQSREFDTVFDPQGLTKSSMLGYLSGAKLRVGFDFSHARELAPMLATKRIRRTARHMVDAYRQLLQPWMKVEPGVGEFQFPIYEDAVDSVVDILDKLDLTNKKWIGLNPGAGWTTRQWPVDRFGHLAKQLYEQTGTPSVVFWAGDAELLLASVIAEESGGAAVVAPPTSLRQLTELIRRCSMLVTGDTGPLHLASAVKTPVVGLHGPTWADESGPYGTRSIAIQSPTPRLTKKMVRKGPAVAMRAIELEEVVYASLKLLRSPNRTGNSVRCAA